MKKVRLRSFAAPVPTRIAQALVLAFGVAQAVPVLALPTGAAVTVGGATVSSAGTAMTIQQSTPKAAINWQQFNIAPGESVRFVQPGTSAIALNRVLGQNPSAILGRLSANGQVFLLNPNGVLFGQGAQVNVGGIVASTLSLSDSDFVAGRFRFAGQGGPIENRGTLESAEGGYVVLLAPRVTNEGTIQAPLGTAALAAGEQVTLTLAENKVLAIAVDRDAVGALVANKQLIRADGGAVLLTARARDALLDTVVNNTGVVEARSVSMKNGVVTLDGGASGVTSMSGRIDASGRAGGETGGRIVITGDKVALMPDARLDASGDAGGGTALIGGDVQGGNPDVRNANRTFVAQGAAVAADALANGDGGKIVVWGTTSAQVHGTLSANGGAQGGDGGFVETSGKHLDVDGARIDAAAPVGRGGTWLLDPYNLTISGAGTTNTDNNPNTAPDWNATGNNAVVQASQIATKLNAGTSVVITTGDGSGAQNGDLTVAASIAKIAGGDAALTLRAHDQLTLNNNVSISSTVGRLDVTLNSDSDGVNGGSIVLSTGASILSNGGNVTLGGGANPATTSATGGSTSQAYGVLLNNATIDAAGGNVIVNGAGRSTGGANNFGVRLQNAARIQTAGAGTIAVTGTGGAGTNTNYGVLVQNTAQIVSSAGNITITGQAQGTGANNMGVRMDNTSAVQTVDGAISVTGTGSAASTGAGNNGVYLRGGNAKLAATGTGSVTVTGTAGTGTNNNRGILLDQNNTRIEATSGDVTLTGTGNGSGTGNSGIHFTGTGVRATSTSGAITITGTGGAGTSTNYGVLLQGNTTRFASTTGDVTVTGQAQGTGANNMGVRMDNTSAVLTVDGTISVTGTGAAGTTGNNGVYLRGGNVKVGATGTGSVSVTGTAGAGTNNNRGIMMDQNNTRIETVSGNVTLTGTGNGSGTSNIGVYLLNNGSRATSTSGDITVSGTGGNGTSDNYGVYLTGTATRFASGTGDLSVTGTGRGTGANNYGVRLNAGAQLTSAGAGTGAIALTGTGAGAAAGVATTGTNTLIGVAGHSGDITVSADTATGADSIVLAGTAIRGAGALFLQPIDPASAVGLAGGAGEFNLSAAELNFIANGFDSITIGRSNGTGSIASGTYTFNADTTLRGAASNVSVGMTTLPAPAGNDAGTFTIDTGGTVTQTGRIAATNLVLLGAGGIHTLTHAANAVGTLAAATGTVDYFDSNALTIGTVGATVGVATTGNATIVTAAGAGNDITLANSVGSSGGDVVLASGEDINYGAASVSAAGRWLTYSRSPAQNTGAASVPANAKPNLYNRTYAGNPPPTITEPGSHNVYSYQPSLTVTADNQGKLYGEPVPALTATITGLVNGDTPADAYSGAPSLATTATPTSSVASNPYPVTAAVGTLVSDVGYAFTFVNGQLTVVPRPVTITADAGQTKVFGDPNPASYTYTITGGPGTTGSAIVAGDMVTGVLARVAGENVGAYAINQGTLAVAPALEYNVTYVGSNFTITPATLTYVANPVSAPQFAPLPAFTGTVTGFKGADTLGSATTGTLDFATTVGNTFVAGFYPVWGSGLTANNGNYVFVQAPGNATAFEVAAGAQGNAVGTVRAQRIKQCGDGTFAYADPVGSLPCALPEDRGESPAPPQPLAIEGTGIRLPEGVR